MFWKHLKVVFGCFDVSDDYDYDETTTDNGFCAEKIEDFQYPSWLDPLYYEWDEHYMEDFYEESEDESYEYNRNLKYDREIQKLLKEQLEDGSWDSTDFNDLELKKDYNQKIKATAVAIAYLSINDSDKNAVEIQEAKRKGMIFLDNTDKNEQWEEVIEQVKPQLRKVS